MFLLIFKMYLWRGKVTRVSSSSSGSLPKWLQQCLELGLQEARSPSPNLSLLLEPALLHPRGHVVRMLESEEPGLKPDSVIQDAGVQAAS